ncbi:MAG: hypothetical protein HZA93_29935 [Verrucomicrobia bacterium]|nr:hypothetical protein [Verrucomicrobiota bacterium]
MFTSPCSLRSAQCATLIALAAAAGLARFEPAEDTPAPPASTPTAAVAIRPTPRFAYPLLVATSAIEWSPHSFSVAASVSEWTPPCALAPAPAAAAPIPPRALAIFHFPAPAAPALSVRKHSHPYAIGPPAPIAPNPLRAAGLARPGDSPARRTSVSRIARVFVPANSSGAHVTRTADSGPASTGSPPFPDATPLQRAAAARPAIAFSP